MLKIQNITRIIGMSADGRQVAYAGDYRDRLRKTGKEYFVFRIGEVNDGKDYDRSHDIVLSKEVDETGKYYMFNMGLERVTGMHIGIKEVQNPVLLCEAIREVLRKTKHYYSTN